MTEPTDLAALRAVAENALIAPSNRVEARTSWKRYAGHFIGQGRVGIPVESFSQLAPDGPATEAFKACVAQLQHGSTFPQPRIVFHNFFALLASNAVLRAIILRDSSYINYSVLACRGELNGKSSPRTIRGRVSRQTVLTLAWFKGKRRRQRILIMAARVNRQSERHTKKQGNVALSSEKVSSLPKASIAQRKYLAEIQRRASHYDRSVVIGGPDKQR